MRLICLLLLLLCLTCAGGAQEAEPSPQPSVAPDTVPLPPDDPFIIHSRINVFFDNSVQVNGVGKQQVYLNPVLGIDKRSSVLVNLPVGWYAPGNTGNAYSSGLGDISMRLFRRIDTDDQTAHGIGLGMIYDTGVINLSGAQTVLQAGYAFEHKPDPERKLILIAEYDHSLGQSQPGNPTRQLIFRLLGYQYFDDAYVGLELRNVFDLYTGSYQPLGTFSVGGEVVEGLQLWGSFRLPLNLDARNANDRLHYTVGITIPL